MTTPPGFEEIQRQEAARLFGAMARARLLLIPLFLALFGWLVAIDRTPWRFALLALALPAFAAFVVVEYRRYRRHGLRPGAIDLNLSFATAGVLLLSTASGGLDSPFIAVLFLIATASSLFASTRLSGWLFASQLGGIWAFAAVAALDLLPGFDLAFFSSPPGAASRRLWPTALVLTGVLVVLRVAAKAIRASLDTLLARTIAAQRESLRVHAERAEELTALSGEIAHELKNPLSSVKGLAALLAQHCAEGKGAERLAVLRREVDRMQATLDEFLNFSRPLVPLALGTGDVAALCREIVVLHEGMAQERGVALAGPSGAVTARCDPRKVRQILINLVQNALDASPRGGTVELAAEAGPGGEAVVRVLDRGRGVEPSLGDAAFRPGVTTKESGFGLGLTIARALARQHGGDLALRPRDGGGTVAEVTLPAAGPAAEGSP
ncbi:MAG TPA: HAMP domain-containing sensor histidine kinase [Anaeromyxobacteraceae bacterium]|nr:HAMP domain-containing sensor histidine kinase [Anaeromyxobacteraceae bacterium]